VAGQWAGRKLDTPAGIRPTTQRAREALFSIWQSRVPGARFLDLFCGSGAVGLEALSRGASSAVLVDRDRKALGIATRNQTRLGAQDCVTRQIDLPQGLPRDRGLADFDLIFADPPYAFEDWEELLSTAEAHLEGRGRLGVEHASTAALPLQVRTLVRVSSRRYGATSLSFYERQDGGSRRNVDSSR
jgi:16S rRNA (guanine966-N2)-methyltransferase